MAYNKDLANRISGLLTEPLEEKKMFGGVGYLLNGNMAIGVHKDSLIVRVGPEAYAEALSRPHARIFDITGREMKGWVMVAPEGCRDDGSLAGWVQMGLSFARTLPRK
ncbi:MAG: TfoX/Sxy family protein [Chloroflexota bacterium]